MAQAPRDDNRVTAILATDDVDGVTTKAVPAKSATGALYVHLDSSDVSVGGGTEYTEGETDATITGAAVLAEAPSNTLKPLQLDASNHLQVDIAADSVGIGGGTEYTEDAAAAADPVGKALILVREDARAGSLTGADGDNVAARGNNKGELYVKTTDSDALLTTIDADTSSMNTDLGTVAGAVSGTEMQVDVVDSLPAGTNNIGDVDVLSIAAGDNNIGNVDLVKVGSVVDANNSTTSTLGGDAVYTGTGTDLLGYTSVTCTLYADVDSATDGMTFQFSTDNSNWDDSYSFTMDVSASDTRRFQFPICARYFRIVYTNGSGAQSAFRVQTLLHTGNQLSSIHRLVDDMSQDRSAQVVKAVLFGKGQGGSPDFKPVDVTNGGNLKISVEEFGASLPAGTNAIGKLSANDGVDIGDVDVTSITGVTMSNDAIQTTGDEAHDAVDAGNPVKVGMKAVNLGTNPTAVATSDRTDWLASRAGIPFTLGGHPNVVTKNLQVTDADGAQTDTAIITVSAGTAIVVTKCSVTADNANTVDVSCRIGFGTVSTPAADATGLILFHPGIAAGSGIVEGSGAGIIGIGASNEDLRVTCEDPVTGSISIIVTYFTISI